MVFTALASICASECAVLCSFAVLSSEESDSWRQCLHSRTDSSTAECVWNCVCMCVFGRERVPCLLPSPSLYASLFPPSLRYSSPLSGSSPLFLPPLHFLSTISSHSLSVSLSFICLHILLLSSAIPSSLFLKQCINPAGGCHWGCGDSAPDWLPFTSYW